MIDGRPLFIIGNPRSGTSVFRLMLTNHKNICIPPECGYIQWWHNKYNEISANSELSLIDFISDLSTSKKIETWNLDYENLKNLISKSVAKSYADYCKLIIQQYSNQNNPDKNLKYFGDKNNYYVHHLDLLKRIFPDAFFVFIFRDPRDLACSYLDFLSLKSDSPFIPKLPDKIDEIIQEWKSNNTKIIEFQKKLNRENFFNVKYEDLIINTENTLEYLCQSLNLEFDPNMMQYYLHNDEPEQLMDWKKKTMLPPDKSSIGRYKSVLKKEQIQFIESECKDLMIKFGYS